jgi:hypothetical protein
MGYRVSGVAAITLTLGACVVPRPMTTTTEVIPGGDAAQAFGSLAALPLGEGMLSQVADRTFGAGLRASGSADCKPCPKGACVQGKVLDPTGAAVAEAVARAVPDGVGQPGKSVTANVASDGSFLLVGVSDGRVGIQIGAVGFRTLKTDSFPVKSGVTYVFDEPLMLPVGAMSEEWPVQDQPRACAAGR